MPKIAFLLVLVVAVMGCYSETVGPDSGMRAGGSKPDLAVLVREVHRVSYRWTAPTNGTPVVFYRVQVGRVGEWVEVTTTSKPFVTLDLFWDDQVRVAGVDKKGNQGGYSVPSVPYNPLLCGGGKNGFDPVQAFDPGHCNWKQALIEGATEG